MLFEDVDRDKQRKVDSVSDRIAERFGKTALRRAIGLDEPPRQVLPESDTFAVR
jgi:hypothetical protein